MEQKSLLKQNVAVEKRNETTSLVKAFQDLSDGVVTLFRQHLELFREEAKRDARSISKDVGFIAIGAGLLAFGYAATWVTIVLGVVAYSGAIAGTWVAAGIAALHLLIGGWWIRRGIEDIKSRQANRFEAAKSELERSSQWVKQIKDSSSPPEQAPS